MPLPDWRPETRAAMAAARVGLGVVLRRERSDEVQLKGVHDPVTGTDLLAQAEIQRVLAEQEPSIAFVGEEGSTQISDADRCWMVDPVCGTSNFAVDLPFYAVNVALVEGGRVMAGVVCDGVTGQMYVAERGHGAWLLNGADAAPLHVDRNAQVVSVDSNLPGPGRLARFGVEFAMRALAEQRLDVRMLATTLCFAYVARGSMGGAVYVCGGLPVHFAAGLLLCEEAGALVTDEHGGPWQLLGPIYVAAASPELSAELGRLARGAVEALEAGPTGR
jgi:myo-inositol-1(or 4)-monophosphatase